MSHRFFDLTFTESVRNAQERYGSRRSYSRFERGPSDFVGLSGNEKDFIEQRDEFHMATVNGDGQPYIQFRGGPRGFLKILDDRTLGFADFRGNMQYVSVGNIRENRKVALFLMDYPNRARLKILASAEIRDASDDPELIEKLSPQGYEARIERAVILKVEAFDWNCPQHITSRYTIDEIKEMITPMYEHIAKLEAQIEKLKAKQRSRNK